MTFEDLPRNWTELPLSTPGLAADVVDLVLTIEDRRQDSLLVLPCDEHDVGLPTPICVSGIPWHESPEVREQGVVNLATIGFEAVVIAISSECMLPESTAAAWRHMLEAAFTSAGTRVLSVFEADTETVKPIGAARDAA